MTTKTYTGFANYNDDLFRAIAPEIGLFTILFGKTETLIEWSIAGCLNIGQVPALKMLAGINGFVAKLNILESIIEEQNFDNDLQKLATQAIKEAKEINNFRNWLVHSAIMHKGSGTAPDPTYTKEKFRGFGSAAEKKLKTFKVSEIVEMINRIFALNDSLRPLIANGLPKGPVTAAMRKGDPQ